MQGIRAPSIEHITLRCCCLLSGYVHTHPALLPITRTTRSTRSSKQHQHQQSKQQNQQRQSAIEATATAAGVELLDRCLRRNLVGVSQRLRATVRLLPSHNDFVSSCHCCCRACTLSCNSHLVSQDAVDAIVVELDHPVKPFQLIGPHRTKPEHGSSQSQE